MKTTTEKLESAQKKIRSLKKQLGAAEHSRDVYRDEAKKQKSIRVAESAAANMWIGYLVKKYDNDGIVEINKGDLYNSIGSVAVRLDEKRDIFIVKHEESIKH